MRPAPGLKLDRHLTLSQVSDVAAAAGEPWSGGLAPIPALGGDSRRDSNRSEANAHHGRCGDGPCPQPTFEAAQTSNRPGWKGDILD